MSLSEYVRREDLKTLYALPMKDASKKLGVSESSLRNICRKHNIERWPYRKFQQLDAHIASLQNVELSQQSQQQKEMIESLLRARSILEENPNMTCEMAILQANKQLLANNPSNGSQVHEMTAQMMNMMNQNQSMIDDASPTISEVSPNLDRIGYHHHGTTFVPSYPTHVTSHLSASAALSAMARRKKNHPQYISNNSSSSILETLDQQSRSTSMFSMQSNPTIEIQQPNRYTDSDIVNNTQNFYYHQTPSITPMRSVLVSSDHLMSSSGGGSGSGGIIHPQLPLQQASFIAANHQNSSPLLLEQHQLTSTMGERRGAVSHRDSLAIGQGFVLLNHHQQQNQSMMDESSSDYESGGAAIIGMDSTNQQSLLPNDFNQISDPNVKSRHISLMKQQRRPSPQPPRSLSTSTVLSPALMNNSLSATATATVSANATTNLSPHQVNNRNLMHDLQNGGRKFTSTTTPPSSSHNSSLRSSSASHTEQFDSPFIDIMQDQEGDISMGGDNFLSSPSILINNRLSDDQNSPHLYQRTSQSSLTSQVSLNRYLLDSPNHDFDFVSKQEQRENNHRILEALRVTPTTPSNSGSVGSIPNIYDPLFDSNAFLRGRTSSVSSTFSDTMSPMTPTEGRLSNASNNMRLSYGVNNSDFTNFPNNY